MYRITSEPEASFNIGESLLEIYPTKYIQNISLSDFQYIYKLLSLCRRQLVSFVETYTYYQNCI